MAKPIIFCIDDEPEVLRAVERDLRARYRRDYRIVRAPSGEEALDAAQRAHQRGSRVALFVSDQRMPGMEGTEFLEAAGVVFPRAKKVLLTAYADTTAAIESINRIGLDHYLLKPWDPPEQALYPVLDDLLDSWHASAPPPSGGLRVAGTQWSPGAHRVKDFLARNRVPYRWLDVEKDTAARALVDGVDPAAHLPVVLLEDGTALQNPDRATLAEHVGMKTRASAGHYDLAVIGAGPAGLAAAVYGASEGLATVLIEQEATGGQAGTSSRIENYLGFPKGLSGGDLAHRATVQAERLGAELLVPQAVEEVRTDNAYKLVALADGTEISCRALILSTGMKVRRLRAPGCEELTGAGVFYGAALTEAAQYRDRPVFVVGGGNSAGQAAMYFSRYASQVTILIRGGGLGRSMSQYLIDQIAATPNIQVAPHTEVVEAQGEQQLERLVLRDRTRGEPATHEAAALFIFIGTAPNSAIGGDVVSRDDKGFILTGADLPRKDARIPGWATDRDPFLLETSVPGIFAAGDVRHGSAKRVAAAVGEGSVAVRSVHEYLATV